MDSDDSGRCPDNFKDPYKEMLEDATKEFSILRKKFKDDYSKMLGWSLAWMGQYDDCRTHPELTGPTHEQLTMRHMLQMECLLLLILEELRKK